MKSEFPAHRYKVHLPVAVWVADQTAAAGVTEYMSNHDIRISVDESLVVEQGAAIMLRISLPPEITNGHQIHLRVAGQIMHVERDPGSNSGHLAFIATMDWYDFVRDVASSKPASIPNSISHFAG
jgi:hypothetical protein